MNRNSDFRIQFVVEQSRINLLNISGLQKIYLIQSVYSIILFC